MQHPVKIINNRRLNIILGIVLGMVFVLSSLSKAVNVEAFSRTVYEFVIFLGLDYLVGREMLLAYCVCSIELLSGLLLFSRRYQKIAICFITLLMVFFTCITYYNYVMPYGGIESCGCFGELVHLTPKVTFIKNIALLFMSVIFWMMCFFQGNSDEYWTLLPDISITDAFTVSLLIPTYSILFLNSFNHVLYLLVYVALCVIGITFVWIQRRT